MQSPIDKTGVVKWRAMVRLNMVVPVEYVEVVANGWTWMRAEEHQRRTVDEQKRYIFESKFVPLLKTARIKPGIFWIQCIPDSTYRPERPPMFDEVGREPLRPELRMLYGYGQ